MEISEKINKAIKDKDAPNITETDGDIIKEEITKGFIKDYHEKSKEGENLITVPENYGPEIVTKYEKILEKCKDDAFKGLPVSKELYEQLKEMCANILSKNKFSNTSGIVIAGFGEREVFPSYVSFTIEAVINNRLKYGEDSYIKIDYKRDKFINVFAQGNIIEAFMLGRDPQYDQIINGYLRNLLTNVYPKAIIDLISDLEEPKKAKLRETLESAGKTLYDDFINKSEAHCRENYFGPIYEALTSLPKDELATVAESLVNLTSFKKRMSLDAETVGGPCDVAVISKGDGFIWIKRKYYFKQEMNPQFFTNYYKKGRLSSGGE